MGVDALTTHASFNGTMWSMSRSLAAVQTPPSNGLVHEPEVAVQAELVWTLTPSRLSTNSLMRVSRPSLHLVARWGRKTYRVLQLPLMVSHWGNRSRS